MAKQPKQRRPEEFDEDDMAVDVFVGGELVMAGATQDDDDDEEDEDLDLGDDPDLDEEDADDSEDDSEDEEDDDSEDDSEDDEDEPKSKNDLTAVPKVKRKKKQTADERIAEVTAKRREAEEEAFNANLALQEMQARVAALENAQSDSGTTEIPPEPKESDFEYGAVDPKYIEAKIEHGVAVETAKIRQQASDSTDQQKAADLDRHYRTKIATIMDEGEKSKQHPNFTDVVTKATFDAHLARMVADSENAVDIAYYLASNLPKLLAVTKMDLTERAREIGKLDGRFSARSAARTRSKAPNPLRKKNRKKSKGEGSQYGPANQDDFDKAFFG